MEIVLRGGPVAGEEWSVGEHFVIFKRLAKSPEARYKNSGVNNENGLRIFDHAPLKQGEAEQQEGVHEA